ncbi:hypothetical protein R1sor_003271 [Riccia sorocarpa]|uniref:Uncharacterized protein n=1 Tax=Riccia sorocarpa TaxID=122646 RepID=A0ABD3H792_9MARC
MLTSWVVLLIRCWSCIRFLRIISVWLFFRKAFCSPVGACIPILRLRAIVEVGGLGEGIGSGETVEDNIIMTEFALHSHGSMFINLVGCQSHPTSCWSVDWTMRIAVGVQYNPSDLRKYFLCDGKTWDSGKLNIEHHCSHPVLKQNWKKWMRAANPSWNGKHTQVRKCFVFFCGLELHGIKIDWSRVNASKAINRYSMSEKEKARKELWRMQVKFDGELCEPVDPDSKKSRRTPSKPTPNKRPRETSGNTELPVGAEDEPTNLSSGEAPSNQQPTPDKGKAVVEDEPTRLDPNLAAKMEKARVKDCFTKEFHVTRVRYKSWPRLKPLQLTRCETLKQLFNCLLKLGFTMLTKIVVHEVEELQRNTRANKEPNQPGTQSTWLRQVQSKGPDQTETSRLWDSYCSNRSA